MDSNPIYPGSSPSSADTFAELSEFSMQLTLHSSPRNFENAKETLMTSIPSIPTNLTEDMVDADPSLKRLQQDLLILTGFHDNSTLHWRPSWFAQKSFSSKFWTLHNPPNVVTERLPSSSPGGTLIWTRRMRRDDDPPPAYIKSWEHWHRYCDLYGVPDGFLNLGMISMVRVGLKKTEDAPPSFPLYPEPQPHGQGRYILSPASYHLLPSKFSKSELSTNQIIIVHSNGALQVTNLEPFYFHSSQWTHFNGFGQYVDDWWYDANPDAEPKVQGMGRRWSYLPWTLEQEESCEAWKLKVKTGSKGIKEEVLPKVKLPEPTEMDVHHDDSGFVTGEDEMNGVAQGEGMASTVEGDDGDEVHIDLGQCAIA